MPYPKGDAAEMEVRAGVDIRPGYDPDARNRPSKSMDYEPGSGGATAYPGFGGPDVPLRFGGGTPDNTSIRNVRIADIPKYGSAELGPMELAGKTVKPDKVPPMSKFDPRPIEGAGPLEIQRLTQQQNNAISMGDPDYSPMREIDYESTKNANFARPPQKSVRTPDKRFTGK